MVAPHSRGHSTWLLFGAGWSEAGCGVSLPDLLAAPTFLRASWLQVAAGDCSGHLGGQPDLRGAVKSLGHSFSEPLFL